jgi:pimeloyl-ACP methyl ester carboxylesterase
MGPLSAADLRSLLQFVRRQCGAERFFFVGGSMGGSCNLTYAVLHPEDVAAVVALCPVCDLPSYYGWCESRATPAVLKEVAEAVRAAYDGPPSQKPDLYRRHSCLQNVARLTMPVYVAHGDADALVPVEQSRALASRGAGARFRYHEILGGDHEAPLNAAILDEGLEWILGVEQTGN